MSTRSCIAYTYGDGWRGRYTHSDGYPTGRGPDVYAFLQARGFDAYKALIDDHPAGFSWMPAPYEDPHDSSTHDASLDDMAARVAATMPGMPFDVSGMKGGGACYASWGRPDETDEPKPYIEEQPSCGEDCDPLFIEWVYVADRSGALTVFSARESVKGIGAPVDATYEPDPAKRDPNAKWYCHVPIWHGRWDGAEPDWKAIEQLDAELEPLTL
jgi:hypothetical protein